VHDVKDNAGYTPLHLAGWNGHVAIAKALLGGGANILAADNSGHISIHDVAVSTTGRSEVTKCLLQHF
jgi:ankyrin repeat protein